MLKLTDWRLLAAMALTLSSAAAIAHDYSSGDLHIDHPWARPTPAATVPAAVYFDMRNHGTADDRLIAAATDRAEHVELHASIKDHETGTVKMRLAEGGVAAPAGQTVSMETGSYHIMLIGLETPLKEGERFPMTLTFEQTGEIEVMIHVEDRETEGDGHHHHH